MEMSSNKPRYTAVGIHHKLSLSIQYCKKLKTNSYISKNWKFINQNKTHVHKLELILFKTNYTPFKSVVLVSNKTEFKESFYKLTLNSVFIMRVFLF